MSLPRCGSVRSRYSSRVESRYSTLHFIILRHGALHDRDGDRRVRSAASSRRCQSTPPDPPDGDDHDGRNDARTRSFRAPAATTAPAHNRHEQADADRRRRSARSPPAAYPSASSRARTRESRSGTSRETIRARSMAAGNDQQPTASRPCAATSARARNRRNAM